MPIPQKAPAEVGMYDTSGSMRGIWRQWFQAVSKFFNTYRTPFPPVMGPSPFLYQHIGMVPTGPLLAVVSGGSVSKVELSRDNMNFFAVANSTNMSVPMSVGDYIRITYTVAPVLTLFPS